VFALALLLGLPVVVRGYALACSIILFDNLKTVSAPFVALDNVAAIESAAIRS
jgi:hypothetical protein